MSFFGFDPTGPKDRAHSSRAPGFGQTPDAFASLAAAAVDDDAIDFEDTYDGLGDQLEETGDAFNDDTFGDAPASQQSIGKDFDFSGKTSQIANTLREEEMLFRARQPPPQQNLQHHIQQSTAKQPVKPARSGYESYADPNYIPQLEARADIWGLKPKTQPQTRQQENRSPAPAAAPAAAPAKKMLSLDEVEAMMRAQSQSQAQPAPPVQSMQAQELHHQQQFHQQQQRQQQQQQQFMQQHQQYQPQVQQFQQMPYPQVPYPGMQGGFSGPPQILQRPQHQAPARQYGQGQPVPQVHAELPGHSVQGPPMSQPMAILQRQRHPSADPASQQRRLTPQPTVAAVQPPPSQQSLPRQILQNPNRLSGHGQPVSQPGPRGAPAGHNRGPSFPGMVITHPEQLLNLSEEERALLLEEDAKRAKRNHKIAQLSKDNGLMTPQDKNFITRIQLQQLMSASGNVEDQGPEAVIAEDFYYQVFSQIRGAPRQTPHQPASQFAQTYLFQTSSRYGPGRRQGRGGDNHMQRMEQQVQRAVEAAKARPKGKQLVFEGTLGKIAFSNSKTPRPLLNIKRSETVDKLKAHVHKSSALDKKATLRNIEGVYNTLMAMEDHERLIPPPVHEGSEPEAIQQHMEWRTKMEALHAKLWQGIKIMEPINPQSITPHPFIAILSHSKGKKAIPRIFRHIDDTERVTVLTMIVVNLDKLSVIANGIASPEEPLPPSVREEIELFTHTVMPPLFAHISESPLHILIGLLGLVLSHTHPQVVARTKIGMNLLTMFLSRTELLKQSAPEIDVLEWEKWTESYNRLFDTLEPILPFIFPNTANDTEDMYVWQFLAAMGVGASPEQQQRLVLGVKDRVMETVAMSKSLPPDMAAARLANVNLFMRAIGLDVELLG